ncbi:MAG: class I SAM-dependent methyltransferase [Bacillota bacterium]
MKEFLDLLARTSAKPRLYEPGEPKFWDDPHISKSMLEAHLDPTHDAASRRPQAIDATVEHLLASGLLKAGSRVLDLGCGPGLYAEGLARRGVSVVGVDISERSLEYARKSAEQSGLDIDYRHVNFLDMDFEDEFDAAIQVYGELTVFSDEVRDGLLRSICRALKENGLFIFDVTTRALRKKKGPANRWYLSEGGFWRPGRHLVLEQGFDYPEEDVWLDQYTVVDEAGCTVYRNWFHDYSLESLEPVLKAAGFAVERVWDDLAGTPYSGRGDWLAVAARRV